MLRASSVFYRALPASPQVFFGVAGIFLSFPFFFLCTSYFYFSVVCSMFLRFVVFKSCVFFIFLKFFLVFPWPFRIKALLLHSLLGTNISCEFSGVLEKEFFDRFT